MGYPNGLTIPPWHMEYPPEKAKIDRENAPFLDHFQENPMNLHSLLDAYGLLVVQRFYTTGACWQRASLVLRSRSTSAPQLKQMIRDQKQLGFTVINNQTWQWKIPIKCVLMGKSTTNRGLMGKSLNEMGNCPVPCFITGGYTEFNQTTWWIYFGAWRANLSGKIIEMVKRQSSGV